MPKNNHLVSPSMMKDLVAQYNREVHSALVYTQLAAVVERDDYIGFSKFFQMKAKEELDHAHKFFTFISDAGGLAAIKGMEEPKLKGESVLRLFEQALDHEQYISDNIFKLKATACKNKEYATDNFLIWFIEEQVEEEASLNIIISNIARAKEDEAALLHIQKSLCTLYNL